MARLGINPELIERVQREVQAHRASLGLPPWNFEKKAVKAPKPQKPKAMVAKTGQ